MLHPGEELAGYTVEGLIGEGATAIVYRVRSSGGDVFALKVLTSTSRAATMRLKREAEVQGLWSHLNLVRSHGLLAVGDRLGLVLDLVEGPTLSALLQRQTLTPEQVYTVAQGLFAGVREIHRRDMVHRDLKPSNVLIERSGGVLVPRIADFGLVKLPSGDDAELMGHASMFVGTPGYTAPEQFKNISLVDRRGDVFSLGAILYHLVCKVPAFHGDSVRTLNDIVSGRYARPRRLVDLDLALETAIVGALIADPDQRIPDVDALEAIWSGSGEDTGWSLPPKALEDPPGMHVHYSARAKQDHTLIPATQGVSLDAADEMTGPPLPAVRHSMTPDVAPTLTAHAAPRLPPAQQGTRPWLVIALVILLVLALLVAAWALGSRSAQVQPAAPSGDAPATTAAPPVAPPSASTPEPTNQEAGGAAPPAGPAAAAPTTTASEPAQTRSPSGTPAAEPKPKAETKPKAAPPPKPAAKPAPKPEPKPPPSSDSTIKRSR